MVKTKLIPIVAFFAASFMLGSMSLAAATESMYTEIQVEHAADADNYNEPKNEYYNDNIKNNDYNDYNALNATDSTNKPSNYVGVEPIGYEPISTERPNIVNRINEVNNVKIDGYIPQIVGINVRAAEAINVRIQESFTNLVNMGHRDIRADFDVHNWGGMTSLVVRYQMAAGGAGERQVVHTFVFDNISKTEVTLRNLLGRDFMSYVNTRIGNELRADSNGNLHENITNFRTIRANQNFYVKDGNIHILFEQARVAHERYGVVEFVMPINTLSYTLSHNQFAVEDGKVFVPAIVARRFGMDVHVERGGVMHIRGGRAPVSVDVHNERKNPNEVIYINGYDVALSAEFLTRELGISVEQVPNSRDVVITYSFNR